MLGHQPRAISAIAWPAEVRQGFDVRDLWEACKRDVPEFLSELYSKMDRPAAVATERVLHLPPMPASMIGPVQSGVTISVGAAEQSGGIHLSTPPQPTGQGLDRDEVIKRYRKWLRLPDAEVLDVMFGMLLANRLDGAPLWLFLVGPPGCGKTELVMSTYGAPLVSSASTMSVPALISGTPNKGTGDPSLIPKWNGRVVAFKDFTVILTKQQKERDEIFGILRGAFDGMVEKSFGSSVGLRRYRSRFGILSGVTAKIEEFGPGNSVVGERFLKYYMRQSGVLRSGEATIAKALDDCDLETQMHEELRETARAALDRPVDRENLPAISAGLKKMFVALAMWTARLRGAVNRDKYTNRLHHKPQSEIGTRLVKQLYRLATGVAIFRQKDEIGMDEYRAAAKVARFSVPDLVEDVVRNLYVRKRAEWVSSSEIGQWTRLPPETLDQLLRDMRLLDIIVREAGATSYRWMLSRALVELMEPLGLYTRERVMARG
jgi:hypothetical protein